MTGEEMIGMGMFDALKAMVGTGGTPVTLDIEPAAGEAEPAVTALIAEIKSSIEPSLRDSCTRSYLEAVLVVAQRDPCVELLSGVLGEPSKPFGTRPQLDEAMDAMVASRGGIDTNQCLFLRRYSDGRVAFAALWPWSNGASITLKLGVYDIDVTPGA